MPNPAGELIALTLNLNKSTQLKISITDVLGNTVMTVCEKQYNTGNNNIPISINNLSKGMYFCLISAEGNTISKKLIKN